MSQNRLPLSSSQQIHQLPVPEAFSPTFESTVPEKRLQTPVTLKKKNTRCSAKRRDAKNKTEQSNKHGKVSNTQKEPSQKVSAHLTEQKKPHKLFNSNLKLK